MTVQFRDNLAIVEPKDGGQIVAVLYVEAVHLGKNGIISINNSHKFSDESMPDMAKELITYLAEEFLGVRPPDGESHIGARAESESSRTQHGNSQAT